MVVVTVFNSFESRLRNLLMAANPQLIVYKFPSGIPDTDSLIQKIKAESPFKLEGISKFEYTEVIISKQSQTATVILKGIEGEKASSAKDLSQVLHPKGILSALNEKGYTERKKNASIRSETLPPILLGKVLMQKIGAKESDTIRLTFGGIGTQASKSREFKIIGTLQIGLAQYDDRLAFISFQDAQELFGRPKEASGVEIVFSNPADALPFAEHFRKSIPYSIKPWQEIDTNLFKQIERDGATIQFIVLIITLVAGFNILVTLNLSVVDKAKHIAILRCLGATRFYIIKIFVYMGTLLGTLGALLGTLFGFIILYLFSNFETGELQSFYWVDKIPISYNPKIFVLAIGVACLLALVSSLFPAYKATKVSPLFGLKS